MAVSKTFMITMFVVSAIFVFIIGCITATNAPGENVKNRHAIIETSQGTIEIELYEDKAPNTTANFIKLAQSGFYNGLKFHRVIPKFMIQTGDPKGDGTGDAGYTIKDEFSPRLNFSQPGMVAMANRGPDTGSSQFFITTVPTPWLEGKHAIFGKVLKGQDIVEEISDVQTNSANKPLQDVIMKKVTIV